MGTLKDSIKSGYFDDLDLWVPEWPVEIDAQAALTAFSNLRRQDRMNDTRHVFAYYRDVREMDDDSAWLDEEMGIPKDEAAIWDHVLPDTLYTEKDGESGHWYVVMDASCDWEEEHGLMLVRKDGLKLTKVGQFDGHLTNTYARNDPSLDGVVYNAVNPSLTTRQ